MGQFRQIFTERRYIGCLACALLITPALAAPFNPDNQQLTQTHQEHSSVESLSGMDDIIVITDAVLVPLSDYFNSQSSDASDHLSSDRIRQNLSHSISEINALTPSAAGTTATSARQTRSQHNRP